jgi:hypothetical protein
VEERSWRTFKASKGIGAASPYFSITPVESANPKNGSVTCPDAYSVGGLSNSNVQQKKMNHRAIVVSQR